jgi:hypothetical protein
VCTFRQTFAARNRIQALHQVHPLEGQVDVAVNIFSRT